MIDPVADMQKRSEQNFDFMSEIGPYLKSKAQQSAQKLQGLASKASDFTSDLAASVTEALPLKGKFRLTQKFGNVNPELYGGITKGARHLGSDLATPLGTEVFAPTSGKVTYGKDKNYGNFADMTLPDGTVVRFSHLSETGQSGDVKAGQRIAKTGSTGNSTGAHLDISARRNGQYIDPATLAWFNELVGSVGNGGEGGGGSLSKNTTFRNPLKMAPEEIKAENDRLAPMFTNMMMGATTSPSTATAALLDGETVNLVKSLQRAIKSTKPISMEDSYKLHKAWDVNVPQNGQPIPEIKDMLDLLSSFIPKQQLTFKRINLGR